MGALVVSWPLMTMTLCIWMWGGGPGPHLQAIRKRRGGGPPSPVLTGSEPPPPDGAVQWPVYDEVVYYSERYCFG